jgi:hypothetical protein
MFGMKVTPEIVRELVDYDPDTGALTWRYRERKWFKNQNSFTGWNNRYVGKPALVAVQSDGYLCGTIFKQSLLAHRVAYAHYFGKWPERFIDHINGIRTDNRISNIRAATRTENNQNKAIARNNSSGCSGVYWNKKIEKWVSAIRVNKKHHHLGCFADKSEAISARKKAEREHGYSMRHGT